MECYKSRRLKIYFELEKDMYLLEIGKTGHFIDPLFFREISKYNRGSMIKKLNQYDEKILENLSKNRISIKKLEEALLYIKKTEEGRERQSQKVLSFLNR